MRPVAPAATARPVAANRRAAVYLSVGLNAGAVIALQLAVMRVFAVGSWAHFGSLVVSLAMLSFGLVSVVLCAAAAAVERRAAGIATAGAVVFAPLVTGANLLAQQLPFNAVFLVADPLQKWRLFANFILYLLPFVAGALFIGVVLVDNRRDFGRIYFADLSGAGFGGAIFFLAMYVLPPENLILVPLLLGTGGATVWCAAKAGAGARTALVIAVVIAVILQFVLPPLLRLPVLSVSDYKGIAYARKFPDSRRLYRDVSPFGDLQVYASSYLHFAPGLSDNAAFSVPLLPPRSFLGLYVDGDGPVGVIADLPAQYGRYFHYLPMFYPYLLKREPDVFIVQFGGGISTSLALRSGARTVTIAETNPAVVRAFTEDPQLRSFIGDALGHRNVAVVLQMGRLRLAASAARYDIIDLSLTSSFGLTGPGGIRRHRKLRIHLGGVCAIPGGTTPRRNFVGDGVEPRGAAEIGPQALRHRAGSGPLTWRTAPRSVCFRRLELSVDDDDIVQTGRLLQQGAGNVAFPQRGDVVRRDLLARQGVRGAGGLQAT